jgi:hypothetical protein
MALLTPPENLNLDIDAETPMSFAAEGSDVQQENRELSDLVAWVTQRYNRAKDSRSDDEERWLSNYRNYRGLYGPDVAFTDNEKSKAFIKITKTKTLAAYAQISDVLFAGGKFPIGIQPTSVSTGAKDAVHMRMDDKPEEKSPKKSTSTAKRPELIETGPYADILKEVEEDIQDGASGAVGALVWEPAKASAKKMEKLIHDQLEESEASKHLRAIAFEMALFGTGVCKGPFAQEKEYPRWNPEGEYDPIFETIAKVEHCSVWDFYPDPEARSMSEADYVVHRHRMSRSQLRALKKRPMFREESIEEAVSLGPDYTPEHWETVLEDGTVNSGETERYEVLEFWGMMDADIAEQAGIELPEEFSDQDQVQVNSWVCNGQTLRLVVNPFVPARIPYHAAPYEANPYSFFGVGIAENMADTQLLMNGFMRMAVDNSALSGNLLIEIDETNLVPGQSMDIYPGRVFRRQSGSPGQAVFGTKFPNVSNELMMMFDKARQLADESTGMPSYAHGSTGIMSTGRTASGMSMLMGAAAQNIKAVVKNIDDYLLGPLGKSMFAFNMQFNFSQDLLGDLEVVSKGTESLMRNEVRSQRLLQFMQLSSNQMMAPFVRYDYILRELAASMDLDEDLILNDAREAQLQAKMIAELQKAMGVEPEAAQQQQPEGQGPMGPPQGGTAPVPDEQGFTGTGGGDNGGQPQPQQAPPQQPPQG